MGRLAHHLPKEIGIPMPVIPPAAQAEVAGQPLWIRRPWSLRHEGCHRVSRLIERREAVARIAHEGSHFPDAILLRLGRYIDQYSRAQETAVVRVPCYKRL